MCFACIFKTNIEPKFDCVLRRIWYKIPEAIQFNTFSIMCPIDTETVLHINCNTCVLFHVQYNIFHSEFGTELQ